MESRSGFVYDDPAILKVQEQSSKRKGQERGKGTSRNQMVFKLCEKSSAMHLNKEDLLRRLHSLYSPKAPVSSQGSVVALPGDKSETHSSLKQQNTSE
ncbi:hypothetical protein ACSBR1_008069 [Camellia fascicularis]